jgi:hypothetical protein
MDVGDQGAKALCGGRPYLVSTIPHGASPYIELAADGVSGPFLLDYGSTRSSLSASAFPGPHRLRKIALPLPGLEPHDFEIERDDFFFQPEKRQIGVLGADLLSRLTVQLGDGVAFLGGACDPDGLGARDLVPVAQDGFFSSDPAKVDAGRPNVPVVFLRLGDVRTWAQIDTGYDDIVHERSIDINEALYARLLDSGAKLDRAGDIDVWTCDGRESRPVYVAENRTLALENELGRPIAQTDRFHLILKRANGCGGIGDMTIPAAQLGASFLRLFGAVVFDPKSGKVWLSAAPSGRM